METIIYFLPAIIALGIITSYEDLKYGKIRNRWIISGLSYAIIMNLLLAFIILDNVNTQYFIDLTINSAITLAIAFIFFYMDIWSAGDGKLFFVFSVLIPLSSYSNSYLKFFPSFNILINIFLPYLAYSLVKVIIRPKKGLIIESLKEIYTKETVYAIVSLFSLSWIIFLGLSIIGIINVLLSIIITMMIYEYGIEKLKAKYLKPMLLLSIIIGLFRIIIDETIYTLQFWVSFILMIIIFRIILRSLLTKMMLKSSVIYKRKSDVKENDVLAYTLKRIKGKIIDFKITENEENNYLKQGTVLSEKEIKMIQKEKKDFLIPTYKRMPFAQIIFLGVTITILLKGNILILMQKLF